MMRSRQQKQRCAEGQASLEHPEVPDIAFVSLVRTINIPGSLTAQIIFIPI
ncbi:MAG: hypothetical protein AAFU84_20040 [Cyanobacteria bacterium J06633_23]